MADTPWDDCKVAFSFDCDNDDIWVHCAHNLPNGWSLVETDCSGARCVAIFRVKGPLYESAGRVVKRMIEAL